MNEEIDLEDLAPWLVIFITLIGGLLRVFTIGSKGMWLDETFSVWLAHHSIPDMLQWIVRIDQHPPLYYILLHYWIALNGDTPSSVRLLSALFGTATIPIIYLIGKRMSGAMVGLAAAVFLALSPFNIYYAQETRMYTLLTFNAAVAIVALVRLLTDSRSANPIGSQFWEYRHVWRSAAEVEPETEGGFSYKDETLNRTGWRAWIVRHRGLHNQTIETDLTWVVFIVFSAATMLSHNTALLFPLATNIFVLGLMLFQRIKKSGTPPAFQAPSFGNWVKAQIGIFLLWSPWLSPFIQQVRRVDQEFWVPKPTWEIVTQTFRYLLNNLVPSQVSQIVMWILYAVLCLGLVFYRKKLSQFLFLAALFAIPFLGELIVSIRRPIFLDRTLIWITIPLFLVLAAGIAQLRFRILMFVVLAIFATNYLFAASDYYRYMQKEDWNGATSYVTAFIEPGDLILFNSNFVEIPFDYYLNTYSQDSTQVQKCIQAEKLGVPEDLFQSGILEPKMIVSDEPRLISLLHGHKRVWLVYSHNSYTDPTGLIPQTLASQMKLIQQNDFYGVQVLLYGNP
jgi:hypothetical protein